MGLIDKIIITMINTKEHQLDIHYKLPIVGDKYGPTKRPNNVRKTDTNPNNTQRFKMEVLHEKQSVTVK